ncbi:MAG: hypothetical protein ACKO5K_12915, partial [Armatimonadota bacterium]
TAGSVTGVLIEVPHSVPATGILRCQHPDGAGAPAPGAVLPIAALREKPTLAEAEDLRTPGLPADRWLGHFGIHGFTADIFGCLRTLVEHDVRVKGEFQLTSAQELLLERSRRGEASPYHALLVDGTRWDIGMPAEYRATLAGYGLD